MGRTLWLLGSGLALAGCAGPDKSPRSGDSGAPDSANTADSGADTADTAPPLDADGDGYTAADGDCDDADAGVHPGAAEASGDGADQDCDGSDYPAQDVRDLAPRLDGAEPGMTFGQALLLVPAGDLPGRALVGGSAWLVGEYGGQGAVYVFSAAEAASGAAPGARLLGEPETSFGVALGAARLADGGRAWLAGLSDIVDYGGFCAWDGGAGGDQGLDAALACIPPFTDDVQDRAFAGFLAGPDLDGDGVGDLAVSGFSGATGEMTGAAWVVAGPLDAAALAQAPALGAAGFASAPNLGAVGDLDGDGYEDVALGDESADAGAAASGAVYLLPGGAGFPADIGAMAGVDGGLPAANTGEAMIGLELDGDGVRDLCVSASMDGTAGDRAGRVGCFYGPISGRRALSSADVTWIAEQANTFFGSALAAIDLDDDGDDELIVGAPGDPYFGRGWPGKVYFYDPNSAQPARLLAGERGDGLGATLSAGDLDGDGARDLLVGAPWADDLTGAAYVILGVAR